MDKKKGWNGSEGRKGGKTAQPVRAYVMKVKGMEWVGRDV